jgi:prevent-host-death family protein
MAKSIRKGAEEARAQLPALLLAAERGRQTIITRHGRPVAVLAPMSTGGERSAQRSIVPLAGTGRGLYGHDSRAALRKLRDEWGH